MSIPRGNGGLKAERPTTHPKPLPHPELKIPGIKVKLEKLPKWLPHPEFKIPVNSRNYGPGGRPVLSHRPEAPPSFRTSAVPYVQHLPVQAVETTKIVPKMVSEPN